MNRDQAGGEAVPRVWWDGDGFIHRAPDDQYYWLVGTNGDTGMLHDLPDGAVELVPVADAARAVEMEAVLRELCALEDEPHPNGHSSDECFAYQDDYRRRNSCAWARARAVAYPEET